MKLVQLIYKCMMSYMEAKYKMNLIFEESKIQLAIKYEHFKSTL